jgi:rhamnogalacturonyl hydrolase YesR
MLLGTGTAAQASEASPSDRAMTAQTTGELIVANLMSRDHMFYGTEALHYSEAATAVGALRFAAATENRGLLDQLVTRYEALLDDTSVLISRRAHVDMNVIGIVPLQIAILTGDSRQLTQGLSFADSQWDEPLENGLFYHSPDVPIFWGRGNGWVAVAMAEVLSSLPADHELRARLLEHYLAMMRSLLDFQNDNGMWLQVVDLEYYLSRPRVAGDFHGQAPVLWLATGLLP